MSRPDRATATIERVGNWIGDIDTVVCDLDGVIWLAHQPISGSVDAVSALRHAGCRVLFVTNNSAATLDDHERALAAVGIAARGDVASSAMAVTPLVEAGQRVLVAGGPGVVEALERAGVEVVVNTGQPLDDRIDAVIVGLHREFDYDRLAIAADAARNCGRLIGTNTDSTYPTPHGLLPGGGSLLAAVASASGVEPTIAGKPHQPLATLVASMLTTSDQRFDPDRTLVIGDRPETDGIFAMRLGCRFALVRSGVSGSGVQVDTAIPIDVDGADLAAVARRFVGTAGTEY